MIAELKPYPAMKDSDVEWLGEVPAHWEVLPLGRVLIQRKEKNDPIKTKEILSLSLHKGVIPYAEKPTGGNKAKEDLSSYMLAYPGDIVVNSMNVVVGSVGLSKYFGAVSPVYYMLRPRSTDDNVVFFDQVFQTKVFQKSLFGLGNGIMYIESKSGKLNTIRLRIPMTRLKKVVLPHPLPEEQTAIVRYLDYVDRRVRRMVGAKRNLIALLTEQEQTIISNAAIKGLDPTAKMKDSGTEYLGEVPEHWGVVALKRLVSRPIIDGPHVSPQKHDVGVPFISAESIAKGYIDFDKKWGYISPEDHELYSRRYKPERGDILLVKLGATTGVPAIVETDTAFSIWVPLAAIRLSKHIQPMFIFYVLRSENLRAAYALNWTYGTQQTLGLGTISNLHVPLPPEKERQDIVDYLNEATADIDSAIDRANREIELLNEYRTRLIADVVTGKLDVRKAAATLPEVDPFSSNSESDDTFDNDAETDLKEIDAFSEEDDA